MKTQKFEDLIAWQKSQDLAVEIYKTVKKFKDYGFKDQMQRTSLVISNNIAEGFNRFSDKDFVRFLCMALGACSEIKSMLYMANRLEYLGDEQTKIVVDQTEQVRIILKELIQSLVNTDQQE